MPAVKISRLVKSQLLFYIVTCVKIQTCFNRFKTVCKLIYLFRVLDSFEQIRAEVSLPSCWRREIKEPSAKQGTDLMNILNKIEANPEQETTKNMFSKPSCTHYHNGSIMLGSLKEHNFERIRTCVASWLHNYLRSLNELIEVSSVLFSFFVNHGFDVSSKRHLNFCEVIDYY